MVTPINAEQTEFPRMAAILLSYSVRRRQRSKNARGEGERMSIRIGGVGPPVTVSPGGLVLNGGSFRCDTVVRPSRFFGKLHDQNPRS